MDIGDRVIWKGANPDGWSGNGRARILAYDPESLHFAGGKPRPPNEAPRGPAIIILIDQGNTTDPKQKKYDVRCSPRDVEIDMEPLT